MQLLTSRNCPIKRFKVSVMEVHFAATQRARQGCPTHCQTLQQLPKPGVGNIHPAGPWDKTTRQLIKKKKKKWIVSSLSLQPNNFPHVWFLLTLCCGANCVFQNSYAQVLNPSISECWAPITRLLWWNEVRWAGPNPMLMTGVEEEKIGTQIGSKQRPCEDTRRQTSASQEERPQEKSALPTPCSQNSGLWKCETINLCCLSHPASGTLWWQVQKTNTLVLQSCVFNKNWRTLPCVRGKQRKSVPQSHLKPGISEKQASWASGDLDASSASPLRSSFPRIPTRTQRQWHN